MVAAFALLPLPVDQTFGRDALDLDFMSSLFGFGGLAGGVLLAIWGGFPRRILTSLGGLVVAGVATFAIGATRPDAFWLALVSMLALGFSLPLINGLIMAIFQATIAADFQGRVFTLLASSTAASPHRPTRRRTPRRRLRPAAALHPRRNRLRGDGSGGVPNALDRAYRRQASAASKTGARPQGMSRRFGSRPPAVRRDRCALPAQPPRRLSVAW